MTADTVENPAHDRERIRQNGDFAARQAYHDHVAALKADVLAERRRLGAAYLAEHADWNDRTGAIIDRATAIGGFDYSGFDAAQTAIAESQALAAARTGMDNPSKGSLEFLGSGKKHFGPESASARFALHPAMLCPAIRYFGMLPILFNVGVNRAAATEILDYSSHLFHTDPEDVVQLKAFVHLVDIDHDTRPFHALPADLSAVVRERLGYSGGRLQDRQVEEIVGLDKVVPSLGPVGTVAFCDTTRCFHYGGRPGAKVRDMLAFTYVLPTSTWFPAHAGDGERRNLMPLLPPDGRSPYWNALIGAELA